MTKILVIDDEPSIVNLVTAYLKPEGYEVFTATDGPSGLKSARAFKPDLIILDIMLPGMDGIELLSRLRRESEVYVILLTAKVEETDKIVGLSVGADDYVTKPFSPRELMAIVKATLRRKPAKEEEEKPLIERGDLKIHIGRYEVTYKGKKIDLTHLEFRILVALAKKPGWVMTRYQIVDSTRGEGVSVTDRSIDVHIVSLRKKLGEADYIETVRGVGYKFKEMHN